MNGILAPLLGCLLGSVVISVALALGISGHEAAALLLGHGGLLLWGWAVWVQQPEHG